LANLQEFVHFCRISPYREIFFCPFKDVREGDDDGLKGYFFIIPLSDREHRGRILRLNFTEGVHQEAVNYLIEQKVRQLEEQDKSKAFIARERQKMESRLRLFSLEMLRGRN
jgi:hypothetical protein